MNVRVSLIKAMLNALVTNRGNKLLHSSSNNLLYINQITGNIESDSQAIKQTLAFVGQPAYAIGAVIHSGGPASNHHVAEHIAQNLINYKYLFLPAPTIDVRAQEIHALADILGKQTVTENIVHIAKQNIDRVIAQTLMSDASNLSAEQVGAKISTRIQLA